MRLTLTGVMAVAGPPAVLPAIGPYVQPTEEEWHGAASWSVTNRLVATPYFYWYDVYSGAHLLNADGTDALTTHPASMTGFSYRSMAWHRQQLLDMMEAGIDVVMPVYWGEPSQRVPGRPVAEQPWSFSGLPPLVAAREALVAEGRQPPWIGMFYDTSTLQFNQAGEQQDLTTDRGRQWFYESIRDFYSLIPARHWAMIEGRPVVFLYSASFAKAHDSSVFTYLGEAFARDFSGRRPYVVREISWNAATDAVYAWGGALGLKNPGVASLGPGYDHSAVPGRSPLVVDREDGAFFERQWMALLRRPSPLVMIETWNEFHEGTDIAHSREYGRKYIELNRRYVDLFKAGYEPPRLVGPYTDERQVEVVLGATNLVRGLTAFDWADGVTRSEVLDGREARVTVATEHAVRYLYVRVDDSFKWSADMEVVVVVDYFDRERGMMRVEYDGSDVSAPFLGAYTSSSAVAMDGRRAWRTAVFRLTGARFLNGQNGGADFRLSVGQAEVGIGRIQVIREGLKAKAWRSGGGFEMQLYGVPGTTYDLEVSTDLSRWEERARLRPAAVVSRHVESTGLDPTGQWYRVRRSGG
jgi:hypothetical protein